MKKHKSKKPKPPDTVWLSAKKFAFLQDWGTYGNETFVAIGLTHDEILAAMRKMGCAESNVLCYDRGFEPEDRKKYYEEPFTWNAKGRAMGLLYMPDWKNNLDSYTTLVHETSHMIKRCLIDYRGMEDEVEAQAYQQQYLFSQIAIACANAIKLTHAPRTK
jgi:hypothetical protein